MAKDILRDILYSRAYTGNIAELDAAQVHAGLATVVVAGTLCSVLGTASENACGSNLDPIIAEGHNNYYIGCVDPNAEEDFQKAIVWAPCFSKTDGSTHHGNGDYTAFRGNYYGKLHCRD